jgi:hypothetical protein
MTENVATRQGSETTTTDPPTNCSTSVAYGFESFPGAQVHSLESNHHDTPFPPPFSLPNNQLVSCRLVLPIVHTAYGRNGTNRCTREPNRLSSETEPLDIPPQSRSADPSTTEDYAVGDNATFICLYHLFRCLQKQITPDLEESSDIDTRIFELLRELSRC